MLTAFRAFATEKFAGLNDSYQFVIPHVTISSMHLTRFTDYGFRVLIYLAAIPKGELVTIDDLVECFGFSKNHLVKVVHQMGRTGWIQTIRGRNGGIRLGLPAEDIRLGDVVRKLEPSMEPVNCMTPVCRLNPSCHLKSLLNGAVEAYVASLDEHTLADLSASDRKTRALLGFKKQN